MRSVELSDKGTDRLLADIGKVADRAALYRIVRDHTEWRKLTTERVNTGWHTDIDCTQPATEAQADAAGEDIYSDDGWNVEPRQYPALVHIDRGMKMNKYLGRTATVKGMVVNGKPLTGKIVRLFGRGRDGQMRVSLYAESPTNLQQAFGGKMTNYTYRTADLEIHA